MPVLIIILTITLTLTLTAIIIPFIIDSISVTILAIIIGTISDIIAFIGNYRNIVVNKSLFFINLSGNSLGDKDLLEFLLERFSHDNIPFKNVCFEITETAAITNFASAIEFIRTLKKKECYFALDDFGSGLSSFAYLKNLPVDYLKIDGAFVKDIVNDPIAYSMVKSINEIGKIMGKQTIAESVENKQIEDYPQLLKFRRIILLL